MRRPRSGSPSGVQVAVCRDRPSPVSNVPVLLSMICSYRCCVGGTDDACLVSENRGNDLRPRGEMVGVVFESLRDAAAEDEEVWPEQLLDVAENLVDPFRPPVDCEIASLHKATGSVLLCFLPPELQVSEFGVRDETTVIHVGAPDPCAKREEDHDPGFTCRGSESCLCESCGVGIIENGDGHLESVGKHRPGVESHPSRVDVGCGLADAVSHHAGDGDTDRAGPS